MESQRIHRGLDHFVDGLVCSDFLGRFLQFAGAVADLQFLFFEILFRQGLDHAMAVEAVGRMVSIPYSTIEAEHFSCP